MKISINNIPAQQKTFQRLTIVKYSSITKSDLFVESL